MRIETRTTERGREVELSISHHNDSIFFETIKMGSTDTWKPEDLYREVNEFFQSLSSVEQDELFALYVNASDVLRESHASEYFKLLSPIMCKIVDKYCTIERMLDFIPTLGIQIPEKIMDSFDTELSRKNRAQTYLRYEYEGLMCMMAVLKCINPIWIFYRSCISDGARDNDIYTLIDAMRLIGGSEFFQSREVDRFYEFTEAVYATKIGDNVDTSILEGVSSSDLINYVFSSLSIDKLMSMPISIGDHNTHLVTKCYHKIEQDCKSLPSKFRSRAIRRTAPKNASDDSKTSWLDIFTVRESVPISYYKANDIYLRDFRKIRDDLDPTIPDDLILDCLDGFDELAGKPILGASHKIPLHQTLVQLVMYDIVQIHTLSNVGRDSILNAMAVTQAYLIHHGLISVAKLFSIYPVSEEPMLMPMNVPTTALKNELAEYCKYSTQTKKDQACANPFTVTIEELTTRISYFTWEICTNDVMRSALNCRAQPMPVNQDIKNDLSKMFVKLMERKKNASNPA
ncbi:MAG: hypothetical protein ACRDDY_13940 [Clostridium sp.]|uniref:hypothetical protein n=1 Tax=Clostridium sp. TaxID=1506 RepID=UPI003EE4E489